MGIDASWLWTIGILMLAVGLIVGILVAYRFLPHDERVKKLQLALDAERDSHREYRSQVVEHFAKTSDLFQEMTDSYRAVYDHLAQGAHALAGEGAASPQLDLPETRLLGDKPAAKAETSADKTAAPTPPPADDVPTAGAEDEESEMEANGGPMPPLAESAAEDTPEPSASKKGQLLH